MFHDELVILVHDPGEASVVRGPLHKQSERLSGNPTKQHKGVRLGGGNHPLVFSTCVSEVFILSS
jgi:hypothetical protein